MEIGIVKPINITTEMRSAYLSYAMSVIVSRALPDARDGLKPVQRRILYAMMREGLRHNQSYSKCAGIVGEVLKKYHPHGDSAVYDALVRLAQPWNMRYTLVDGQGNFGCFTGDTKIKLLDGTERTFAELAELPAKQVFHVYSVDSSGRIVIGEGHSSRITRRQAQLVELTFDDGSTVRCTPDHRFMLRDGSYKQAHYLTLDDSLMAGYFDTAQINERTNDYLRVKQPATGEYEFVHRLADEYNERNGCVQMRNGSFVRHHKNFNRFDNRPENIERLGWLEHMHLHAEQLQALWEDDAFRQVMPELYDAQRHANWVPNSSKVLKYFSSFDELLAISATHNHRVVQVRWLDERVDVYDITVDEYHNFMLANGCVVHNSVDGDPAAAYRYTEARLTEIAEETLVDIDKNTVDFQDNFDSKHQEPRVLPALLPNLLLNGASGIAVGMATNIPPHNLGELCDALMYMIEHRNENVPDVEAYDEVPLDELIKLLPGPDFPTGASILGTEGILNAYRTGRGQITLRAKAHIEEGNRNSFVIVVTELPYQVNKARLAERIAELTKDRKIEGVRDVRDESDRSGMRLVVVLKQDAQPRKVLNALYKHTQMQTTFGINMLALVERGRQPRVLTLKQMLREYIEHRREVIRRRTEHDLERARHRAHILEGLKIALDNIDAIIRTIRESRTAESARNNLMRNFSLSEIQAAAILDMQLRRLAALERKKIEDEYNDIIKLIAELEDILANPRKVLHLIQTDLAAIKEKYNDERRTRIMPDVDGDVSDEDLIPDMRVLITLTHRGYIKRQDPGSYRTQRRGGRGIKGMLTRDQDMVAHILTCNTLDDLLFFTDRGKVYQLKAHELPDAGRTTKGLPLVNLISLEPGEQVTSVLAVPEYDGEYLLMATVNGKVKRTLLKEYAQVRSNGLIAIGLEEGDLLSWVRMSQGHEEVMLTTRRGQTIRFRQSEIRPMGRPASGVIGVNLGDDDRVVAMDLVRDDDGDLLVVTEKGFGKRTRLNEYPTKGRATGGVITIKLRPGDSVASARVVSEQSVLTFISSGGIVMRTSANEISQLSRLTQGVTMVAIGEGDRVAALEVEDEEEAEERATLISPNGS